MPLVIGMLMFLREVNMAINSAIVYNKYAKSTAHFLFFNHRWYPERHFLARKNNQYMRRWWVGVDQNSNFSSTDEEETSPVAPTMRVGTQKTSDDGTPGIDVKNRQHVRIRIQSFVCLPPFGDQYTATYSEGVMQDNTFYTGQYAYCTGDQ